MSADFSIRPVGASVAIQAPGPAPDAAKSAVPTELPPDKAVSAPAALPRAANQIPSGNSDLSHQVMIDRAAAEIVYRVVDNRTSLVVRQFPDDAKLRARAYLRAQDEARQERTAARTDRTA